MHYWNHLYIHQHSLADIPAVDHNRVVTSPTLHLDDLLYHSNNGLHVSALALWVPVLYVELSHFVYRDLFSVRLKETSMCSLVNSHVQTHYITCRLMTILRST